MHSIASGKRQRMINAQNREASRKICSNGESGLQKKTAQNQLQTGGQKMAQMRMQNAVQYTVQSFVQMIVQNIMQKHFADVGAKLGAAPAGRPVYRGCGANLSCSSGGATCPSSLQVAPPELQGARGAGQLYIGRSAGAKNAMQMPVQSSVQIAVQKKMAQMQIALLMQ